MQLDWQWSKPVEDEVLTPWFTFKAWHWKSWQHLELVMEVFGYGFNVTLWYGRFSPRGIRNETGDTGTD